jgi:hypothetical protein
MVVRLGDDQNWWVEEVSDDIYWGREALGVLDPQQVRYVTDALEKYRPDGYRRTQFQEAFQAWRVERQLEEGLLRLVPTDESFFDEGAQLFALPDAPLTLEDELEQSSRFLDFMEALEHLRIKHLNRTHHYAHDVDEFEMEDELRMVDADRYFAGDALHVFEEIREVLEWAPEEWEDKSESQ